jgi:hypothetical protein
MMKFSNFFWALILIAIGLLVLFSNFGWLDFHWISIWRLWPLILIFWGISILPVRDYIKIISVGGVLAITFIFYNQITEPRWHIEWNDHAWVWDDDDWDDNWDDDDWDGDSRKSKRFRYETQILTVPMETSTPKAILDLDAGAGSFRIDDTTDQLLTFEKRGDIGNYTLLTEENEAKTEIQIRLEKNKKIRKVRKNEVSIELNPDVVWDFDLDIGAAAMEMDLTQFMIDTIEMDAGAASVEIKLGKRNPTTYFSYSAGASSLELKIPKEAACEIHSESFLVSRDFDGFVSKDDGIYQTENYPEGTTKIKVVIESAISSLEVQRY